MLSSEDLERLIAVKKREIQMEKTSLGLTPPREAQNNENKENETQMQESSKKVVKVDAKVLSDKNGESPKEEVDEPLQADLERYIRRYIGLPAMLKAGEFSPNNPLSRTSGTHGDALLGLGEYERRSDALRRLRQREYRECLLQQARRKQEEKERELREQREQDLKERERELRLLERDNTIRKVERVRETEIVRRDTAVQVAGGTNSVGCQTELDVFMRLSPEPSPAKSQRFRAERELSPRTVRERDGVGERRSYDERRVSDTERKPDRITEVKKSYTPSILDADAIQLRNAKVEQEAAAKRHSYQQELKNQIEEQQRIKEERKAREKLLEQAETRRLEQQLKLLKIAQEREVGRNQQIITAMADNAVDYEKRRNTLQNQIDHEKQLLSSRSISRAKKTSNRSQIDKKPYSTNIPQNSLFSPQYDVDSYLRKNLNPKRHSLFSDISSEGKYSFSPDFKNVTEAQIHTPKESTYEPSFLKKDINDLIQNVDDTPIPVLRHTPKIVLEPVPSDPMSIIEDKWKVPIVQKNILKSIPSEGKNVSILTQLGSIRRQLQLEQLRLDQKLDK